MSKLVAPHGGKGLVCALLEGAARDAELQKAAGLKLVRMRNLYPAVTLKEAMKSVLGRLPDFVRKRLFAT